MVEIISREKKWECQRKAKRCTTCRNFLKKNEKGKKNERES
jgi:hypothetical protein